jgi:hypothetical protein
MSLNAFLLVIMLLLPLLLFLCYNGSSAFSKKPIIYFFVIALAMVASYWTFSRYAMSHGKHDYYKNTDYHIIQQDGFNYHKGQVLRLASDIKPDSALLAKQVGELWVDTGLCLHTQNFALPLYVENKDGDFFVANNMDGLSMDDGDQLTIMMKNDTLLKIKYLEIEGKDGVVFSNHHIDSINFVFSIRGKDNDTVKVPVVRKGYNLADLLQHGRSTRLDPALMGLFRDCYLLRDHYRLDAKKAKAISAKIYLFVNDRVVNDTCLVFKNGEQVVTGGYHNLEGVNVENKRFYFGLPTSKTPVYRLTRAGDKVQMRYRLPIMYHFPDDMDNGETQMYLTTDINDIVDHRNDFKCFYQFSEQLTEHNVYKATAVLNFIVDSAGKSIDPVFSDMLSNQGPQPITIGEEFEVKTVSDTLRRNTAGGEFGKLAQVSYVFKVRDMRDNEVYRYAKYLYLAMLLLLAIIYLLPRYVEGEDRSNRFFILETSVYLVLIAFLTVRLVLLWRLHTFPPIENVSHKEFMSLIGAKNFYWTCYSILFLLICRIFVLWLAKGKRTWSWGEWFDGKMDGLFQWVENGRHIHFKERGRLWKEFKFPVNVFFVVLGIVLLYFVVWLMILVEPIKVVTKEALAPILAFFINSIFLVACIRNKDRSLACWFVIVFNTVCYLLFLCTLYHELGMLFPMIAVFAVWFFIAAFLASSHGKRGWPIFVTVVAVLALLVVFLHVPLSQKPLGKKIVTAVMPSRTKARVETLAQTPSEMVQDTTVKFNDKSIYDILNASSNKWFIDNHLIQRNRIAGKSNDFILDKQYHQNAVKYETQTRDVMLLRYVIYEHGKGLARKMIWILALLAFNVFVLYRRRDDKLPYLQQVPLQSALFLLLFSAYLYLVNINAVVFVGLDFPFLTLTSKVAPLGLLLPLFAMLIPVDLKNHENCLAPNLTAPPDDRKMKFGVGVASLFLVLLFVAIPSNRMRKKMADQTAPESFSVSMEPMAKFVNGFLNPALKKYQVDHKDLANLSVSDGGLKRKLTTFLQSENGLDNNLDHFNKEYGYKGVYDNFIRSAFDKFLKTKLTETRNILHVKKTNGRFVFVTNPVYYEMKPLFENDTLQGGWHGDLLASGNKSQLKIVSENGGKVDLVKAENLEKFGREGVSRQFVNYQDNGAPFEIYQIPAKYCYDSEGRDVFVMVSNSTGKSFQLAPLSDVTNILLDEHFGLRIMPNDKVRVDDGKWFSIVAEDKHYFSKRIHYNGKHQPIYPLKNKFMFAYNFDQMLADSYHGSEPVTISLDYDLLINVMDHCEKQASQNRKAAGDGFTITAIDGNGRIRLLADYNPHKVVTTDPNQAQEVKKIMDSVYLNGDNELERGLLQNRNLARMPIGPGSTIKVPFYVALLSEVDLPWEKLGVWFTGDNSIYKGRFQNRKGDYRDVVAKFGPDVVKGYHKLDGWDEMANKKGGGEYASNKDNVLGAENFIATSNNYYFGSILMLGSYSTDELNKGLGTVLVPTGNVKTFPDFVLEGQHYRFGNGYLDGILADSKHPALEWSLQARFNFMTTNEADNLIRFFDRSPVEKLLYPIGIDETGNVGKKGPSGMNALYVYSTRPMLLRDFKNKHAENDYERQDIYNKHFNLTSGGALQLDVTPLDMAEMYLRLALQKKSDEGMLTYNDTVKSVWKAEELSTIAGFPERMRVAYEGMRRVIYQSGGTLYNRVGNELKEELARQGIYLYGKTGTAASSEQYHENYHYAFILTDRPIHEKNCDREGMKVYVVYFGFYNGTMGHTGSKNARDQFLLDIIRSESFQNYWKGYE